MLFKTLPRIRSKRKTLRKTLKNTVKNYVISKNISVNVLKKKEFPYYNLFVSKSYGLYNVSATYLFLIVL